MSPMDKINHEFRMLNKVLSIFQMQKFPTSLQKLFIYKKKEMISKKRERKRTISHSLSSSTITGSPQS